ncbi:hypothetical protein B0H15DRAFT_871780, partial [Mycena belliarum]
MSTIIHQAKTTSTQLAARKCGASISKRSRSHWQESACHLNMNLSQWRRAPTFNLTINGCQSNGLASAFSLPSTICARSARSSARSRTMSPSSRRSLLATELVPGGDDSDEPNFGSIRDGSGSASTRHSGARISRPRPMTPKSGSSRTKIEMALRPTSPEVNFHARTTVQEHVRESSRQGPSPDLTLRRSCRSISSVRRGRTHDLVVPVDPNNLSNASRQLVPPSSAAPAANRPYVFFLHRKLRMNALRQTSPIPGTPEPPLRPVPRTLRATRRMVTAPSADSLPPRTSPARGLTIGFGIQVSLRAEVRL